MKTALWAGCLENMEFNKTFDKRRSKFMKRIITFGVVISMLALLAGCGDSGNAPENHDNPGKGHGNVCDAG